MLMKTLACGRTHNQAAERVKYWPLYRAIQCFSSNAETVSGRLIIQHAGNKTADFFNCHAQIVDPLGR